MLKIHTLKEFKFKTLNNLSERFSACPYQSPDSLVIYVLNLKFKPHIPALDMHFLKMPLKQLPPWLLAYIKRNKICGKLTSGGGITQNARI